MHLFKLKVWVALKANIKNILEDLRYGSKHEGDVWIVEVREAL